MANKINSWAEFQAFMDDCCQRANADPDVSGHGRWWRDMTFDKFKTNGTVKGERIVVVGDPANSILMHALLGDTKDFDEKNPNAKYGRMPANASKFFDKQDIDEIGDWIGRGCPDPSNVSARS